MCVCVCVCVCVQRPSGDDLKDFFRNLQRHMKRKKKTTSSSSVEVLQEHAPHVIGDHAAMDKHPQGKTEENKRSPARQRHTAFTPIRLAGVFSSSLFIFENCALFLSLQCW